MSPASVTIIVILLILNMIVFSCLYDSRKLNDFKSQLKVGTKLTCHLRDIDSDEDRTFNAVILKESKDSVELSYSDKSKCIYRKDLLYRDGWKISR